MDGSFVLLCRAKPRPTTKAVNMPRSSNHRSPRKISRKVQPPRTAALRQSPPPPPLPPALQSLPAALTNQVNSSFCTCSTSPVPSSFSYPSLSMCVYFYAFLPAALTPNPRRCLHSLCLCVLHVKKHLDHFRVTKGIRQAQKRAACSCAEVRSSPAAAVISHMLYHANSRSFFLQLCLLVSSLPAY